MADEGEDTPLVAQAPVEEAATKEAAPVDAAEAPASEDKPAEAAKAEEVVAKDAKSPKKSPAKAKKEESAVDEPTVKKGRAKKEKKEDAGDDEDEEEVGQYWEVQDGQKRQRKSLDHFKVEVAKVKEFGIQKGSGKALKDIETVVELFALHSIKKTDPKDPLKELSRLLFNRHGGNTREMKHNLLEFSGFVFADAKAEENMKARIHKKVVKDLKDIMNCLALERNGSHAELADRLFDFLKKPSAAQCSARTPPGTNKKAKAAKKSKKRSASGTAKKTPAKKGAKKSKKDEVESDDDEEEEEEEEEAKEEVKASPKKKAKTAPKKKAAAAADDDDSDMDAPLVAKVDPYLEKLKAHVKSVISEQDMDSLTLRKVRDMLADKYKVDIEKYKSNIREFVDELVSA